MATLTTIRAQLRKDLHDEDSNNYRWVDATLDRHIERAKRELSYALPREQKTTLLTSAGSRDVSISGLSDLIRIVAVEWPAGEWPPVYVQFSVWETTLTLQVEAVPAAAQDVHVYWGNVHTVDASTSTVPAWAEEALLAGAAGYAAVEWASFATNRANVSGTGAVDDYEAWGRERLRDFRAWLRRFQSRVRTSRLYTPAQAEPDQSTVVWDP
jgi:hypothetical protein